MYKITLKIDGMMCGMCESHVNDAIRRAYSPNKVTSSHGKGETVIISQSAISEDSLRDTISAVGYDILAYSCAPYERKGFFSGLFGK